MKTIESIAERLKRLRVKRGLSIKETATLAGVSVSSYREWEYGRAIRGEPYAQLADVFKVPIAELITGELLLTNRGFEIIETLEKNIRNLKSELGKAL